MTIEYLIDKYIDFAKKHFTSNSIFVNTDNDPNWILLGTILGLCYMNKSIINTYLE